MLTRTDTHQKFTKEIKASLCELEIPVFDAHAQQSLLTTDNVRLLLAYLRLIENPGDSLAWATLLDMKKGIGKALIQKIEARAVDEDITFAVALDRAVSELHGSRIAKFVAEVRANLERARASRDADPKTAWADWIAGLAVDVTGASLDNDLLDVLREMDRRLTGDTASLGYYVSQLTPTMKDLANEQQVGVRFMTMSGSKGLTARATFVVGVDDNLIPSPMNKQRNEEVRLLYVAMTRAQQRLVMTWALKRGGNQARAGRESIHRRNYTEFLRGGPIESKSGEEFVKSVVKPAASTRKAAMPTTFLSSKSSKSGSPAKP